MEITKIAEENVISFPVGSLISSRVPPYAVGDLLQVHEFLFRFQEVLGVKEPLSFEELETELLCSWPDCLGSLDDCPHGLAKSSILGDKLTVVYMALLTELLSKLLDRIDSVVDLKLVMLPVNQLTWPEMARRYIMAYALLTSSGNHNNDIKLIRCLYGDGGIYCGSSSSGVEGVDLDARLLGRAVDNVFRKLKNEGNTLCVGQCGVVTNVPEWAKVLDPVRNLQTNVGSRIRQCVYEALMKNPPEWAKEQLEASIAKDVYKGNASGPTKNAVKAVLDRAESDVAHRLLPPPDREDVRRSRPELLCRVIMKKCYYVLGCLVAPDYNKNNFSDLVGMNYISNVDDLSVVLGSASTRPLDLQTINFRLLHGTYGASHEAFHEDVRDVKESLNLWIKLKKIPGIRMRLVNLDKMSKDLELLYENEVATLFRRFFEYTMNFEFSAEVEQELVEILTSVKIPEMPLERVICKVCGINRVKTKLLLCDTNGCNSVYHTYCLDPPLSLVPKENWHCPTCARPNEPQGTRQILQLVDKSWKEGSELLDIAIALEETEYWELEADKKIILLKQLCEESLHTAFIRRNLNKHTTKQAKRFLGIDSAGSMYWGFPNASTPCGIVVNRNLPLENSTELNPYDSGTWCLFHSNEEINNLVNYLTIIDPEKTELIDSVLKWHQSIAQGDEQTKMNSGERSKVYSTLLKKSPSNCLATKATALLEATFGEPDEAVTYAMKSGRKSMAKWNRCDCLEPIFHSRYHCARCHETFFTNIEFQQHKTCTCSLNSSLAAEKPAVDWLNEINFPVPESSLKPIIGKSLHILRQLKINLLDMEAALPVGAKRSSRASPEWRSAWCAFVKTANTIYEMVEATLVLETMIKTEYINNTWWWYWSSVSAAAKTSTLSALALRIYTLDAAIDYQKTSSRDKKQPRKMRKTSEKAKEQSKKAKDPEEKTNNKDVAMAWDTTQ